MNNVLLDELPEEWNGYKVNTWFQVGIQVFLLQDSGEISNQERTALIIDLMFEDEAGYLRPHPQGNELVECIRWFMSGWNHDRTPESKEEKRLIDFDIDQWRIYADFRQIYGINLNEADLHFWEFMGMLWNMPQRQSSFLQVIEIRKKQVKAKMGREEKEAIRKAQQVYGLEDSGGRQKREYSEVEKQKIDDVDKIREQMKAKKHEQEEALAMFQR